MLYQEGRQKMKRMINLTSSPDDLSRYEGAEDLKAFCRQFGCDGYEYQNLGDEMPDTGRTGDRRASALI